MPRQQRYFIPDIPQHVVTRGVDRQAVFFQPKDYALYRDALCESATRYECRVHAYVLMTNHVHLLITPKHERALPLMMQAMGRNYVQRLNKRYGRTGTLWEGRYRASLVQTNDYLLTCQRYIELNPVRAGMTSGPGEYPFSSYRYNALGEDDPVITPHSIYLQLARQRHKRLEAYRSLFLDILNEPVLKIIRQRTNACSVIGNEQFKSQISSMLGREVPTGIKGRPRKRN